MKTSFLSLCFVSLSLLAGTDPAWLVDVCNGRAGRVDYVASCELSAVPDGFVPNVVETGFEGETLPAVLDRSGARPVLSWTMPGVMKPYAVRTFKIGAGEPVLHRTDLSCEETNGVIRIRGRFFELEHPRKGGGGFPRNVHYRCSGYTDREMFFLDRVFCGPRKQHLFARDDANATARVVFKSPLRIVVEAQTGYGEGTPDGLRAVYRYVYTANAPTVEVSVDVARTKTPALDWPELHVLHLSRTDRYYDTFLRGAPLVFQPMLPKGGKSAFTHAPDWLLMSSGREAMGVGGGHVEGWDAANEFCYYVRREVRALRTVEAQRHVEGVLYFGPAFAAEDWFAGWVGAKRAPQTIVTDLRPPRAAALRPQLSLDAAQALEGDGARLAFGDAKAGFACTGLLTADGTTRFFRARVDYPGLWHLKFRRGLKGEMVDLDNRTAQPGRCVRTDDGLRFAWERLDVGEEKGVVDVVCDVAWSKSEHQFEFRLKVANRSTTWGLWTTEYPCLGEAVPPGEGDALVPGGNWGGRLLKNHRGSVRNDYPAGWTPMQFMAFNRGEAGVYVAAHDGAARPKTLRVSDAQDVSFEMTVEHAGLPGTGVASDFPVVVAPYAGDWWQAAKKYRAWALRQPWTAKGPAAARADYPKRLLENGFWLQLDGDPETVERQLTATLDRVKGRMPLGVHWYQWHQIPFDNSYPEYKPARKGFEEAAQRLKDKGVLVMPYINGRLWDRDIPSFEQARPFATKKADGEPYFETYGSGRWLAPMCPATACWQNRMSGITTWLMDDCHVGAIYLDQIGAANPAICFDAGHGHPIGGGRHWVDGYRKLLTPIHAKAAAQQVVLTTENTAEPYMDNIDAYLTWSPCTEEDRPVLPAVYGDYTTYFSSNQSDKDDFDAWRASQLRDMLWGCQLGWMGYWMLDEAHRRHFDYLLELAEKQLSVRDFIGKGELLGEVPNRVHAQPFTVTWRYRQPKDVTLPATMATLWRAPDGRRLLAVGNLSPKPCLYDGGLPWTEKPITLAPGEVRFLRD